MRSLDLPYACLLLLAASCISQGVAATQHENPQTHRILRAATRRSDLYRRSMRITKKFETELAYIEAENGWSGESTFASQVRVSSKNPVLNLEEIEHHLKDVQCSDGGLRLDFVDASSARDAFHSCHGQDGGLVITSHESCNVQGERTVYKVNDVSFANDGEALELSVVKSLWQDAFDRVDISFGHTADDHLFRRHSDFASSRTKRQTLEIPANTSDSVTTATFDLKSELIDTTFPAENFLAGLQELVPIPQLPIEIGCNNCSIFGRIALTQGAFNIDLSQIDLIPDIFQGGDDGKENNNVITGGFFELAAIGVGAHVDLFARPKASGSFEISLFSIPVVGFVIPGIGKAGAVFEPRVAVDFDISGGFELNYGFDITIPNDSKIRLELTDLAKSGVNGFPGSKLTPLPFLANITDIEILLGLAFKPTIPVGFEFLDKLKAEVFITMNLPRLDAKLSSNIAANCGNGTNTTLPASAPYANTTVVNNSQISLGPLALVEANISVSIDTGFSVAFPLLPPPFDQAGLEANLFKTSIPLVTACVAPEKAFESVSGIVPAPPAKTYTNASVKVSVTPTPYGFIGWNTTTVEVSKTTTLCLNSTTTTTKTMVMASSGYHNNMPGTPTKISGHVSQLGQHSVSTSMLVHHAASSILFTPPVSTPAFVVQNVSSVVVELRETSSALAALPIGPTIGSSVGSLAPSNVSVVPAQQTGPALFTGASAPGVGVPALRLGEWGWQVGVLGVSLSFGVMIL